MPLLRAFSTLGCPELSLAETCALAARHGIEGIELRALAGTTDLPALFRRQFGSPPNLAAQLRESPARIVSLDTSWRLGAPPDEIEWRNFLDFVPWAEALGLNWLRVFDLNGAKPGEPMDRAALIHRMAESAAWWRTQRREQGWKVDLMVETHDVVTDSASIGQLADAVPGVAILWDTHHTWRAGEDPVATWRAIRSSVVHIHVKDSLSRPGSHPTHTYVRPGEGEFPMAALRAVLQADGFHGAVSLEWEKLWHPSLPSLDEALTVAAERGWW
jgi:sugar phosphate isomerase/epimerase